MTATRLAVLLLVSLSASSVAEERAFVEVRSSHETCFVGEPVRLTVRFGLDADRELVQPFRRELDVPVRIEAPWLEELAGATPIDEPAEGGKTFALNDDVARAQRVSDRVFEYTRLYRPTADGAIALSAPVLRYSFATRFEESFVDGRVPLDPQAASARGTPLEITVLPLPEDGRPAGFTGAVGRFTVSAAAAPLELAAGETLKLVLIVRGAGNIADFAPPRLEGLAGFHVFGAIDGGAVDGGMGDGGTRDGGATRLITYDLSPLDADVAQIPALAFAYFDPAPPAGYRSVLTKPIPIDVRPGAGAPRAVPDETPADATQEERTPFPAGAAALLAAALVVMGVLLLVRRRASGRAARAAADAPAPAARFRATADGSNLADALATYLAGRLDCPPAAVIDPGLVARLTEAGVPDDLAARTATLLESLIAARYGGGGGAPPGSVEAAHALVDDLEGSRAAVTGSD